MMRSTIDLPDDLHAIVSSLAHDRESTLSGVVVELLRRSLEPATMVGSVDRRTGFPLLASSRVVTPEDVRRLDDDE